jgi:hypothetical protein
MSNAKHTPGPWELRGGGPQSAHDIWSREHNIGETFCNGSGNASEYPPLAESFANARLIAAAPELLAALEIVEARLTVAARAFFVGGKPSELRKALNGWIVDADLARDAIAKAKGCAE